MKKLFYLFLLIILVGSCARTKDSDGTPAEVIMTGSATYYSVSAIDYYIDGMHYKVFNSAPGNIFVVNVTKDKLECENLKKYSK